MKTKEIEKFIDKLKKGDRSFLMIISPEVKGSNDEGVVVMHTGEKGNLIDLFNMVQQNDSDFFDGLAEVIMLLTVHKLHQKIETEVVKKKTGVN